MEKPVSAADANRKFSKLLRAVREGQSYVVTSHGKAVAKIVPVVSR
jgi:prevent-host-death family protein